MSQFLCRLKSDSPLATTIMGKLLTKEEIGLIEWESATLDMSFIDDYPKEVQAILQAQYAHDNLLDSSIRADEREKILVEIDNIFYLAPTDDDYLRILLKGLYKAIEAGRWVTAELGQILKTREPPEKEGKE